MTDPLSAALYFYLAGAWVDVSSDLQAAPGISASWGIRSNKPTDLMADTGRMSFVLNNQTGKYSPGHASALTGWKKGVKVKLVTTFSGVPRVRWYGTVDEISIDAGTVGNRKVRVTALDWLDYASNYPLNNPAVGIDQKANQAVATIVAAMPIQPLATSYSTGTNTFPTVFNQATNKTRAYSEFTKLAISEFAPIYLKKDRTYGETLVVEASNTRTSATVKTVNTPVEDAGFLLTETGDYLLLEDGGKIKLNAYTTENVEIDNAFIAMDVSYGNNIINQITTSAYPTKIYTTPSLIYNLESPLYIAAGDTINFRVPFTDATSQRLVAALTPTDDGYTKSLLHFDTGQARTVYDESGKIWDASDIQLITNIVKFGNAAGYFDGTAAWCDTPSSQDFEFGTGDFVVEWWEYRYANSGATIVRDGTVTVAPFNLGYANGGANLLIRMSSDGITNDIASDKSLGAISLDTWNHFEVNRNGTTFRAFKNGTQTDTWTSSAAIQASTGKLAIGRFQSTVYLTAVIDEVIIKKGTGGHTANFTVATEPSAIIGKQYAGWTGSDSTGTELTASFVPTISYGSTGADVSVENTSASNGYLTLLRIYSFKVESISPIDDIQEDATSYNEYGYSTENISQPYQQTTDFGKTISAAILLAEKQPRTVLNSVTMNANRSNSMMTFFNDVDVGDLVTIIEDQTGINSNYFVQGVSFDMRPGASGQIVNFSWILKEA